MKQSAFFLALAFVGLLLQATILGQDGLFGFVPDLLLVLCVLIAFRSPTATGLCLAFGVGLLGDAASMRFLGPNAAGCMSAFLMTVGLSRWVLADHGVGLFGVTMLASGVKSLVIILFQRMYFPIHEALFALSMRVGLEAVSSGVVAMLIVWFLGDGAGLGRGLRGANRLSVRSIGASGYSS